MVRAALSILLCTRGFPGSLCGVLARCIWSASRNDLGSRSEIRPARHFAHQLPGLTKPESSQLLS